MIDSVKKAHYFTDGISNKVYATHPQDDIIAFYEYDFSVFLEKATAMYERMQKNNAFNIQEASSLRTSIEDCHPFVKNSSDTIFDKIVIDCWIDTICRRLGATNNKLWNAYLKSTSPVERAIFTRLCDFKYGRAINQWTNLLRIQEYIEKKIDFLFLSGKATLNEIKAKRSYFNMAMNLGARELSVDLDDIGNIGVTEFAFIPNAPFMLPSLSREIVKKALNNLDYDKSQSDPHLFKGELADEAFLNTFSMIKDALPEQIENFNSVVRQFIAYPERVYLTKSLRAILDFEIDLLLIEGVVFRRCERCGKIFCIDHQKDSVFCDRPVRHGKKCIDIIAEAPKNKLLLDEEVVQELDNVTLAINAMRMQVGKTMTIKEFTEWYSYMNAMRENVAKSIITQEEFDAFLESSQKLLYDEQQKPEIKPIVEAKSEPKVEAVPKIKKFEPPKISRSELSKPSVKKEQPAQKQAPRLNLPIKPEVEQPKPSQQPDPPQLQQLPQQQPIQPPQAEFAEQSKPAEQLLPKSTVIRNPAFLKAYQADSGNIFVTDSQQNSSSVDIMASNVKDIIEISNRAVSDKSKSESTSRPVTSDEKPKEITKKKDLNTATTELANAIVADRNEQKQKRTSSKTKRLLDQLSNAGYDNPIVKNK